MAEQAALLPYDLTPKIGEYIDIHLLLKILSFYEENKLYPEQDLLQAKLAILSKTNMVNYAIEIYRELHQSDAPAEMTELVEKHTKTLEALKEVKFLKLFDGEKETPKQLLAEEHWNLAHLQEQHQVTTQDVEQLHELAKFYYESGSYVEAAELLNYYRALVTETEKKTDATWGKLASEILVCNWEEASKDIQQLQELIEEPLFDPAKQLQQKAWLANWSLFFHFQFWESNGLSALLDMLCSERFLPAIQGHSPWILRYLTIAAIVTKSHLKELVKAIELETHSYTDPIIEFILSLYHKYDFLAAEEKLKQCGPVLQHDYIVNGTSESKGLIDLFLSQGRTAICEAYCKIHSTIDIGMMATKLGKSNEESERWIVNLIRNAKLDAKIDSANNQAIVLPQVPCVYQQLIEKTKTLMLRTGNLVHQQPK